MNTATARGEVHRPRLVAVGFILAASLFGTSGIAPAGMGQRAAGEASTIAALSDLLGRYEAWGFSGVVLVGKDGRVVFEAGYGLANRATRERNTPATRFDFASVAKTFTGAAVLLLEADGLLSTEDLLERHIGPMPERKSAATIHHLATHTAGLAHRTESVDLAYGADRAAWIGSMKAAPFESAPGEQYRYSNAGISLLAAVVEEVAGAPFERIVRERLFARVGLDNTSFISPGERAAPGVALGYLDASSDPAPDPYGDEWGWGAIGSTGIVSTVGDIHAWYLALRDGDVLPTRQMQRAFDPEATEAYGWHVDEDSGGRRRVHKGGGLRAMQSQVIAYPDEAVVIVWAHNNMTDNWRQALNRGIAAVVLGDEYTMPPIPVDGMSSRPQPGWYATEAGTLLSLAWSDDGLSVGGNGLGVRPGPLRAGSEGGWVSFDPAQLTGIELTENETGGPVTVRLIPGDDRLAFAPAGAGVGGSAPLAAPSERVLSAGREVASAFQARDHLAVWQSVVYRPLRGAYAAEAWADRVRFVADQLGGNVAVVNEAWVRRNGDWRYWRTLRGASGTDVVLRFAMTESGLVRSFGMNPVAAAPDYDEIRAIE